LRELIGKPKTYSKDLMMAWLESQDPMLMCEAAFLMEKNPLSQIQQKKIEKAFSKGNSPLLTAIYYNYIWVESNPL